MSRKQKALEEKYKKRSWSTNYGVPQGTHLDEMYRKTEQRLQKEMIEFNRACTLEDVTKEIDDYFNGNWYYVGFQSRYYFLR